MDYMQVNVEKTTNTERLGKEFIGTNTQKSREQNQSQNYTPIYPAQESFEIHKSTGGGVELSSLYTSKTHKNKYHT